MADENAPDLRLQMVSQPLLLSSARAMIGNLAQRLGYDQIECGQISLAVDEALCNVINHGYDRRPDGPIWISVWGLDRDPPGMRIVIEDRAAQVDPEKIQSRDLDEVRPGGLGVYIIREIMDDVTYEKRDGGGMRLTMIKRLARMPDEATGVSTTEGLEEETQSKAQDGR